MSDDDRGSENDAFDEEEDVNEGVAPTQENDEDEGVDVPTTQADDDDTTVVGTQEDGKPKKSVVLSTLPLVFPPAPKARTTMLVEIDSQAFDLEG